MQQKLPHRLSKVSLPEDTFKDNIKMNILGKRKSPEIYEREKQDLEYCFVLPESPPQNKPIYTLFEKLLCGQDANIFDIDGFWPLIIDYESMSFSVESILSQKQLLYYPGDGEYCLGKTYLVDYSCSPCKCIYLGKIWTHWSDEYQYLILEFYHLAYLEKGTKGIYNAMIKKEINKNFVSSYDIAKTIKKQSCLFALQVLLRYIISLDIDT